MPGRQAAKLMCISAHTLSTRRQEKIKVLFSQLHVCCLPRLTCPMPLTTKQSGKTPSVECTDEMTGLLALFQGQYPAYLHGMLGYCQMLLTLHCPTSGCTGAVLTLVLYFCCILKCHADIILCFEPHTNLTYDHCRVQQPYCKQNSVLQPRSFLPQYSRAITACNSFYTPVKKYGGQSVWQSTTTGSSVKGLPQALTSLQACPGLLRTVRHLQCYELQPVVESLVVGVDAEFDVGASVVLAGAVDPPPPASHHRVSSQLYLCESCTMLCQALQMLAPMMRHDMQLASKVTHAFNLSCQGSSLSRQR